MEYSDFQVEQITSAGEVVLDHGEILSREEMVSLFQTCFDDLEYRNNRLYGTFEGEPFCIYFKNVSYLGYPHPIFKKRIQIGDGFKALYEENLRKGIHTLLIGVYRYQNTILFVDFDVKTYVRGKAHNSSAHVSMLDLKNGLLFGVFQKEDIKKNVITVFSPDRAEQYLDGKFRGRDLKWNFISVLDDFFAGIDKHWNGLDAYREMLADGFRHALQSEWPGYYLEYSFQKYIAAHHLDHVIHYRQDKKKDGVDLDLYFPQIKRYGDLKAHSNYSSGIQGNDLETVEKLIQTQSVYYVVCNHDTEKDSNHHQEVTVFWNRALGKTGSFQLREENETFRRFDFLYDLGDQSF